MGAVVLLSGGIDSTTCATMAVQMYSPKDVTGISFTYGQKHEREIQAAARVASTLGIRHEVHHLNRQIFAGGTSTLIEGGPDNPTGSYADLPSGVSPTYVPFRNGNLLSLAAALASKWQAREIWFGAHADDAARWAYPDCTPEFIGAMANAIYIGTYRITRLVTPLEWMTKANVVGLGLSIRAPYELTVSCYNGGELACGKCPTCLDRLAAFSANGVEDPIAYANPLERAG